MFFSWILTLTLWPQWPPASCLTAFCPLLPLASLSPSFSFFSLKSSVYIPKSVTTRRINSDVACPSAVHDHTLELLRTVMAAAVELLFYASSTGLPPHCADCPVTLAWSFTVCTHISFINENFTSLTGWACILCFSICLTEANAMLCSDQAFH